MAETFGIWDYVVFALTLLISAGIGLYYRFTGGRQKTAVEYLLADRNMGIIPVSFSLMAGFMSSVTLLGVSSENYSFGTMFLIVNLSYGIFTPIAAYLYLPVFFNLGATSVYEYLEKRFGKPARLTCSLAFSLQMILYMGVVLYTPALTLEAVTGMSRVWAILTVGLVCTFYSTIGGLKAVLITDVFQSLLMFAAIYSVIISASIEKGGLSEIWRIAEENGRIEFWNFSLDPTVRHTWWNLILGGGVTFLSLYAVNQAQVQRYLAVKDIRTARTTLWINFPLVTLLSFSTGFAGLAILSKYIHCDPLSTCQISASDQLMPFYVVETMQQYPGLSGLFVSGIFSAALSTVSGAVNSLAAITVEDYIKPIYFYFKRHDMPENGSAYRAKLTSVIYGMVSIAVAFGGDYFGSVLQAALTIFSVVGGPILGLFTVGMFFPFANQTGALVGFLSSLAFSLFLGFNPSKPALKKLPVYTDGCLSSFANCTINTSNQSQINNDEIFYLFRLSYMWLGVLGLLMCVIVGIVVSLVASHLLRIHPADLSDHLDPNLFVPPVANHLKKRRQRIRLCALRNEESPKDTDDVGERSFDSDENSKM
ncbi:putative sodium-dependent multivitamin transporter [Thrips palmi]|uniref:Sodium-dependent multivitamin transporter n=1 Tax=Thrips palmi TaxID=161013 RepID=A0A6P8YXR5_THRPL|nr:putative sodium-dependent multivitamin transporter [Thrips palmi]XP_034242420.1 putative sodium-dependent multivitamin transporter [Thrips palmi]XP_034242503.1 putative sodium-dependent multivitamin transporter [Thrips palmi]